MLRQLARLTAPVPAAGERACAIAVYADARDQPLIAADLGLEGVACVDDVGRAVVLLCDVWEKTGVMLVREWAETLIDFLDYMQLSDGRFVNFIVDWSGDRNDHGPTSYAGGGFWHARGVRALAKAWLTFGDERAHAGLLRGLALIREGLDVPADVRSIHALMAVELLRAGQLAELRVDLERWVEEIAGCRSGAILHDNPDETDPHLWGHVQEGVLAEASVLLDRPDLLATARASALAYLRPLIESGFDAPTVQPYGVASAVYSVERIATITGDPLFARLTRMGRAWFHGRNPAHASVCDAATGRVHDGIDDGVLNAHAGAESNIVGAQALLDEVVASLVPSLPVIEASFGLDVRRRLDFLPQERSA
jgi:hypothetical protein